MKIRDESLWQQFLADIAQDPNPLAPLLRDFSVAWADAAEVVMIGEPDEDDTLPMEALRQTLRITEVNRVEEGRVPIGIIGAALVLMSMHWEYGETIYDEMTVIERHIVEDVTLLKLYQLKQQATTED